MRFLHLDSIDSTNAEAIRQAENGVIGPIWITSEIQTKGRGRRGRDWVSQTGNLFCTGLYPCEGDLQSASKLSFVAALALAQTLETFIDPRLIKIKWPNDVLVDGKKIAGILLEITEHNSKLWIAIGVGINIISCPNFDEYEVTYLLDHINADELDSFKGSKSIIKILAQQFDCWRQQYLEQGFKPVREAWLERAQGIGESVKVNLPDKSFMGTALGLSDDGALEVRIDDQKIVKIHAGDVFFS
ncbi:MAG: biotin--[acetyl-CoA-carboxylase] ligase [Robiginitomaculum sp.]